MTFDSPPRPQPRPRPSWVVGALAADVVLVVVFAALGRASHTEDVLAGLWQTSWPFLAGVAVGWLVQGAWRNPLAPIPTGAGIWGATLVVGMFIRAFIGQGIEIPFVIVAAVVLFALLVGWRGLLALARRRAQKRVTS